MPSYRSHSLEYKFHSQHKGSSTGVIVVQYAQWVRNWTHNSQVWGFQQWTLNPKQKVLQRWLAFIRLSFIWSECIPRKNQKWSCHYYYFLILFFFYVLEVSCKGRNVWSKEIKSKTSLIKHQLPLWYKIFSICSLLFAFPVI